MPRVIPYLVVFFLCILNNKSLLSKSNDSSQWVVHTTNCKFSDKQKFSPFERFQQEFKEIFWMLEYLSKEEFSDTQVIYTRIKPLYAPIINRIIHLSEAELAETRRDTSERFKYMQLDQFRPFRDWFDILDSSKRVKMRLVQVKWESFYTSSHSMIFEEKDLIMSLLNDVFWDYESFDINTESIKSYQRYKELSTEDDQDKPIDNDFYATFNFALDSLKSLDNIVQSLGGSELWGDLIPLFTEYKTNPGYHVHTLIEHYKSIVDWCQKTSEKKEALNNFNKHFWFFVDDYEFSDTFTEKTLGVDLLSIRQALTYFPNLKSQRDFFGNIDPSQKRLLPADVEIHGINNVPWGIIYIPELYDIDYAEEEITEEFNYKRIDKKGIYFGPLLSLILTNTETLNESLNSRQLNSINAIVQTGIAFGFHFGEGNKAIISYGRKSVALDENGSNYDIQQFQLLGSTRILGNQTISFGINESFVFSNSTLSWFDNIPLNLSNPEPLKSIFNDGFSLGIGADIGLKFGDLSIEFLAQYQFDLTDNRWENKDQFINSESSYSHSGFFVQSVISYKLF